jgi:hypothetical protein
MAAATRGKYRDDTAVQRNLRLAARLISNRRRTRG